jgi:type I restriction enzyme S subunit
MTTATPEDWLQQLGSTWPSLALGYRYEVQLGKMLDEKRISGKNLFPYLRNVDVQWGRVNTKDLPEMDFVLSDQMKYSLRPGDLLVCEGGEVGRAAIWPGTLEQPVYFQKALHRLRPYDASQESPRFMFYALQTAAEMNAYGAGGKTTIAHLPAEAFRRIRFPKPPLVIQELVADFLDEQTARIDALVAEKERLLAATSEYFRARLGTAVVQGLRPSRPMHNAEAKGFEEIPLDWQLVPLKHLASVSGGMTPSKDNEIFWVGEIPWVSPKDMKRFVLHDSVDHISQEALDSTSLKLQPEKSVLVVVRGMILAHTFPVALNAVPVTINQDMKALRANSRVSAEYLAWMLRGLQPLMLALTEESAHGTKALRTDQWANQCVPVPPLSEQEELVNAFTRWDSESNALSHHIRQHIDRLREYRSSLISAAVTGQLDTNSYREAA